jgi:hypothetical protein
MKKLIFCTSLLIFSFGAKAQFYLSSGETITVSNSNDFFLQEDMINGGTITNLTINGSNALNISGTGTINNLIVNKASGIATCIGGMQTITGIYTPTAGVLAAGGYLTFKSTASATAQVAAGSSSGGYITGNVTVERYIPAKRAWRFLTSPLMGSSNNSIFYNWQNNDQIISNYGVEIWSATNGVADPSSANSGMAIGGSYIKEYNSATNAWDVLTNTNTSTLFDATTNKAYSIFVIAPYNNGNTYHNSAAVVTTINARGTLIQGTHTKNLGTATAGQYFLVGNPYASAVSPATISLTNLASNFYMWDPNCAGTYNVGQYNTYNRTAATYSLVTNSVAGTVYTNTTPIQSGQAFFVQALATGTTSLTFNETDKVSGSTNVFRTSSSNVQIMRHTLKKSINGVVTNIDGALGIFYNGANAAVDYNDAAKFSNSTENIILRRANSSFAIEERPLVTENDTLFVRLTNTSQSAYTLELTGENFTNTPGLIATLKDAYNNTSLPLSITDTNRYNFAVDANAASTGDRFMIVFKANSTLPVQFTYINATQKGAAVQVDWKVATEKNIKQYVVEKSTNGISFTTIATQAANNIDNSSYTAMDNNPITGSNYYRILSTDNSGKQQYSNVAVVKIGGKQSSISVYPNPVAGNVMNLQLENIAKGNYTIQLVNTQGSVVMQTKLQHAGGSGTQSIQIPTVSNGNYVLKTTAENGVVFTEKVVVGNKF